MNESFDGKVALVTGAGSGMGLATARGIRVNAVCPGMINTPMAQVLTGGDANFLAALVKEEPIGRFGESEEIADAVLWLCSPGSSFVIGHALAVDGGITAR